MKQNQKQKEPKYRCSVCGDEFRKKSNAFTPTRSILYKGNGGLLTICKTCVGEIYTKYLEKFDGDEYKAIKRMCMLLDIYFCDSLFEASKNSNQLNRMNAYLSKINLVPYINKTFDDYLFSSDYEDISECESFETKSRRISSKYIKVWGYGFSYEEYQFLEGKFSEWKSKVVIDSMARESLVRDLCVIKLQQQKAIQSGDVDLWGRLQKTFQDTLSSANLKPIQAENDEKTAEKPLGVMIEMFENEDPIPEINPEWKDIDGIVKLFNIYFLGHLSKMLGIKNRYSKDYEEEMQKYRAEIDDIKDASDAAVSLRDSVRQGKLRLIIHENEANENLGKIKKFGSLDIENQVLFQEPFYQTTALINEMVNLSFTVIEGRIKIENNGGTLKDRFSAVSYANLIANELERNNRAFQNEYEFQTFIN